MTHLQAADGDHAEAFGCAVAIDGNTAMVGAYKEFDSTGQRGALYVFERMGTVWAQTQKIQSSDASHGDSFAWSVDLEGDRAIVGAPHRGGHSGGAYTFVRGATGWAEEQILDGWAVTTEESFGTTVALSWPYAIVGARETAYHLERQVSGWEIRDALVASDYQPDTGFGRVVALDGGTAVVAAEDALQSGVESGASYVFGLRPEVTNYCVSESNSTGSPALMDAAGSASVSANNLELSAGPIQPNEAGIFYYGAAETEVPFGNGNRCVGGGIHLIHPLARAGADGYLHSFFDNTTCPAAPLISAGTTWKFQAWYRDPASGGLGYDLSDGLSVFFGP